MATEEQRNANIVISADTTQYVQGVQTAAQETSQLQTVVDKLGSSLDGLASKVGKRLVFGGAGALAGMTAAAKVAANYDQQLNTLRASAVYTGTDIGKLDKSISQIAKTFPVARAEVVGLVEAFSNLGVKGEQNLTKLTEAGIKLGGATGENIQVVSTSLANLSRTMGTLNPVQFEKFSSALAMVSKESGTSATQVASFAQALAPFARVAGITQNQVLGLSASFTKAGADGYAAANTFNTMVADITRLSSTNSPMLAKYANLIGMTTKEFKALGTTEGITRVFEEIGGSGPDAVRKLDLLGYDGIRASKSIQQVANQSGGLRAAIASATEGYNDKSKFEESYKKAFQGWNVELDQTKELLAEITRNFGQTFLPLITEATKGFNWMLEKIQKITGFFANSIFGKILGSAAGGAAVTTAGLGALLMALGTLTKLVTAVFIGNSGPVRSLFAGFRGGQAVAAGLAPDADARYRAGGNNWWNRPFYGAGQAAGGAFPMRAPGAGPSLLSRGVALPFRAAAWYAGTFSDMAQDAAKADPVDRKSRVLAPMGAWGAGVSKNVASAFDQAKSQALLTNLLRGGGAGEGPIPPGASGASAGTRARAFGSFLNARFNPFSAGRADFMAGREEFLNQYKTRFQEAVGRAGTEAERMAARLAANERIMKDLGTKGVSAQQAMGRLAAASVIAAGRIEMTGGKWIGKGIGKAGGFIGGLVGIPAPFLAAGAAIGAGAIAVSKGKSAITAESDLDQLYGARAYSDKLGLAPTEYQEASVAARVANQTKIAAAKGKSSIETAASVSALDIENAKSTPNDYVQKSIREIDTVEGARSYVSTLGKLRPEETQLLKEDLLRKFQPGEVSDILKGVGADGVTAKYDPTGTIEEAKSAQKERNAWWILGDESRDLVDAAYGGINAEAGKYSRFGGDTQNVARAGATADYIASLFKLDTNKGDERPVFERGIKKLEEQYGDFNFGVNGASTRYAGLSKDEIVNQFLSETQGDAGGIKLSELLGDNYSTTGTQQRLATLAQQGGSVDSLNRTIRESGTAGALAVGNAAVTAATTSDIADPKAQSRAVLSYTQELMNAKGTTGEVITSLRAMKDAIGNTEDPLYKIADAAEQLAARLSAVRLDGAASTADQRVNQNQIWASKFGQADQGEALMQMEEQGAADRNKLISFVRQYRQAQTSMSRAQEDFNTQRQRAEDQYNLQRSRALDDFNLQRERADDNYRRQMARADEDYNTSRQRSYADFTLSMERAQADFHTSQKRAQRDFDKAMKRMAEDAAQAMYDPYKRVTTQMTWDTENLLQNLQDQTQRMKEQSENLKKLRDAGVSQEAIDQLGLADAANAQQTARITADIGSDPSLVGDINKEAKARADAAKDLATDESNKQYRRSIEDFNQSMRDAEADFKKSQARSEADFKKSLARSDADYRKSKARQDADYKRSLIQQETDFKTSLARQRTDWNTSRDQQLTDFNKSMDRQRRDMATAATELYGDLNDLGDEALGLIGTVLGQHGSKVKAELKSWLLAAAQTRAQIAAWEIESYNNGRAPEDRIWLTQNKNGGLKVHYPAGYNGPRYDSVFAVPGVTAVPGTNSLYVPGMADGGIRTSPQLVQFAERGPEMAIPLDQRGMKFITGMLREVAQNVIAMTGQDLMQGQYSSPVKFVGNSTYNYDNSVNVNGPVTVKSDNPNDFAQQMAAKARQQRLTRAR